MSKMAYRYVGIICLFLAAALTACTRVQNQEIKSSQTSESEHQTFSNWREVELADVITGELFRIQDFHGSLVIIDFMAVWCGNCLLQQQQIQFAMAELGSQEVVVISLDVEPKETKTILAQHMVKNNIEWPAAVAPKEMIRSLTAEFGDPILFVSSTPLVFIHPDGEAELIQGGLKTKKVIMDYIQSKLD